MVLTRPIGGAEEDQSGDGDGDIEIEIEAGSEDDTSEEV